MQRYFTKDTTSALQFFQAIRFGTTIVVSILMVRFLDTLSDVGLYEQFIFAANILGFFWSMGICKSTLSYHSKIDKSQKDQFLPSVLILLIILGGGSSVLAFMLGDQLQVWLGLEDFIYWKESLALLFFSTPIALIETSFTLNRSPNSIFKYSVLAFSPIILAAIYLLTIEHNLEAFIYTWLIWNGCRFIYTLIILRGPLSFSIINRFFFYSLPLIGHVILGNGMEFIDGIIVNHYFDTEVFPVFRYGARELPISTIFIAGIVASMIPIYKAQADSTLAAIKNKTQKLMTWLFPFAAVLMLASPMLFTTIYGKEFLASGIIFNIYLLVLVSRILLPQIIIQAVHHNHILLISALIEVVINVGLSLMWVEQFGLFGIASATFIAYLVNKFVLLFYVKSRLNISLNSLIHQRTYWTYSLLLLLAFTASWFIYQ